MPLTSEKKVGTWLLLLLLPVCVWLPTKDDCVLVAAAQKSTCDGVCDAIVLQSENKSREVLFLSVGT